MNILLPTENTGGPREGMELFYGEEVGEQVIWKPTSEAVPVVDDEDITRSSSNYLVVIF